MKNSIVPKIVIAAGLAAVYATGLAMATLRHAPESKLAQNAAVEAAPLVAVPESTDTSTSVIEQPAAITEAPAPVPSVTASKPGVVARKSESVEKNARSVESTVSNEPSPVSPTTSSRGERSDFGRPDPTGEVANVGSESAVSTGEAPASEQDGSASSGNVDLSSDAAVAE
ncbi:MAG: hypothetical protein ABI645_15515 [Pseudomonadota bacterium]